MEPTGNEPGTRLADAPSIGWRELHAIALRALDRLSIKFDAALAEGFGHDPALEQVTLVRPSLTLTPADTEAAPLAVAFTEAGLYVRFGQWCTRAFPAIEGDSLDNFIEERDRFVWRVVQLIEGRFREASAVVQPGLIIQQHEFWSDDGARAGGESKVRTNGEAVGAGETILRWQPWSARRESGRLP